MTSIIEAVTNRLSQLRQLGEGKDSLDQRKKLLTQLRIDLTNFENLPPNQPIDQKQCILAREIYEHATFLAVELEDIEQFERNFSVVKTYYDEFEGVLPPSQKKYSIIGLYLLYLLAFNKITEFHTEIELIPHSELSNVYIQVPMKMESYFVEGSYNMILNSKQNVPLQAYHFFIDKFVDAIRYEIARSSERAYESLSLKDMAKIFMIKNQDELRLFIQQQNNKDSVGWSINESDKRVYFVAEKNEKKEIPSVKMINTTLQIATELNRII